MEEKLKVGDYFGRGKNKKQIKEKIVLSNGWILLKTEDSKSERDFRVKIVFSLKPQRTLTPRHAHFLIDFYGKMCADKEKAKKLLLAIYEIWKGTDVKEVMNMYEKSLLDLPGYPIEYILYALRWILEQEDINFKGRPKKKQEILDEICKKQGIETPKGKEGSQLAVALLCDVMNGTHPVEALLKANLDIRPLR